MTRFGSAAMKDGRRAFTILELSACIAASGILASAAVVAMGSQPGGARASARQKKDSMQVRGVHQALIVFSQNNGDQYPLPSKLDKRDFTVEAKGRAKDTTANIYSIVIFNGSVSPEMFVSPVEKNPAVAVAEDYSYSDPKRAATPEKAIWDPGFAVSLGPSKGNASYAHLQPAGVRRKAWSNTFSATECVLSTRGPQISGVEYKEAAAGARVAIPSLAKPGSVTLSFFEPLESWSGHLTYNDNHVEFAAEALAHQRSWSPKTIYKDEEGKEWPDVLFFDEPADKAHSNAFLGLFTTAGAEPGDYTSIWD
jgi:prepilin-type N-terminal cleavage/methylation domain-containing protein